MPKTYIPRRPKLRSHLAITNPIAAAYMPVETLSHNLALFFRDCSEQEFKRHIKRLCTDPRTRRAFGGSAKSLEEMASTKYYKLTSSRIFRLFDALLDANSRALRDFLIERRKFETNVLLGRYDDAEQKLDEIGVAFGDSLWIIRAKILLLHLQNKPEDMQSYAEACRDKLEYTFSSYLTNSFLIVTANPALHLNKTVRATIKEFSNANHNEWADLVTLTLVPQWPATEPYRLNCFSTLQLFPVIDQLILLRSLLSHNSALDDGNDCTDEDQQRLLQTIHRIDEEARVLGGFSTSYSSADLIRKFETGDYRGFIDSAQSELSIQWRPLTIANLVAKSLAILGQPQDAKTPIDSYISHLQSLYSLSVQPKATESKANSLIAILNYFSDSYDLQYALVKTMPHRFGAASRRWTARRNAVNYGEQTQWDVSLSDSTDPLLSHQYTSAFTELPESRRIKARIKEIVRQPASFSRTELFQLMEQYRRKTPLARDYHELSASVLQRVGDMDLLVEACSVTLAKIASAYTAFPMDQIVSHIEENRITTLDAVVAAFFYAKHVDKKKEYVLNEVYEEFLLSNGASKPSELLRSTTIERDRRFDLLLSEVSTLETMDFLGCFDSSSALSAERVRILDYLREMEWISPENHRTEVDEIVSKVVVDTTATEFNVAKIDVNDDAIRREVYDDVASLLAIYQTHDKEKSDRVITIDREAGDGTESLAMVVGDKGTALHKIVNLITSVFVGDEKHGLARNLSAEVRHGFFSNQMRARLDEANILTERDAGGEYQQNRHWLDRYEFVADDILLAVDEELRWFSARFNDTIQTAEEWMKIAMLPIDNKSRLFRFDSIPFSKLENIEQAADTGDVDLVIDRTFEVLWEVTEDASQEIRLRINSVLRRDVDELFNELLQRIETARGGAPLVDLTETLQACRGGLHEDLTAISEWFRRANSAVTEERSIPDLIRISVECLNRVRGSQVNPSLKIEPSVGRNLRFARDVRCFIIAVVNLLENSVRHSGLGIATPLAIEAAGQSGSWSLCVFNGLTEERLQELRSGALEKTRERMKELDGAKLVQTEGGSGLTKVISHLKSIDDKYRLDVRLDNDRFCAEIIYEDASTG